MAILTPSQLTSASNATYFDNVSGSITPTSVRSLNDNWISSSILASQTSSLSVLSASYAGTASVLLGSVVSASYSLSSSFALTASYALNAGTSIDTGSFVNTSSFNAYTASINGFTGSIQTQVNNLQAATASYITSAQTSSMSVLSASRATSAANADTASYVASVVSASYAVSSSQAENATLFNSLSSSQFAQLVANNTFTGNNVFGNVTASNAFITSASVLNLYVQYETASVIYSSGSNQFGDAANDTQTLWGTVNVVTGPLLVTGSARVTGSLTMVGLSPVSVSHIKANDVQGVEILTNSNATVATFGAGGGTGVTVVGQVNATTFSGSGASIFGIVSSSYAITASSAVTALTASYVLNAVSSSFAQTASYVEIAQTASYILNAVSSSFATSASYALSSSLAQTASYAKNAQTASYVLNAVSSSFTVTASYAVNASTASFLPSLSQSLTITGSVYGNVLAAALSASPYTSSIDASLGNFWTITTPITSSLVVSNLRPGQTLNGLVSIGNTSASMNFPSNIKQPSGSPYIPSYTVGQKDVLSFITFDGTNIYMTYVKNLV